MKKYLLMILCLSSTLAHAQIGTAWAWDAGKIKNNGNISLKSNSGSETYSAVQNPTGAVAKVNQSTVTQPPTVIIQATGNSNSASSYSQILTFLGSAASITSCPASYTNLFTYSGTGCNISGASFMSNAGGSKWNLVVSPIGMNGTVAWLMDGSAYYYYNGLMFSAQGPTTSCGVAWTAMLCAK